MMEKMICANLRQKVLPIAKKYGLEAVYLFGSRARGENTETSDYDFFVKRGKLRGMFQLSGLFTDLQESLQSEVDIVLDPEGVGHLADYMVEEIERDKVLIYG